MSTEHRTRWPPGQPQSQDYRHHPHPPPPPHQYHHAPGAPPPLAPASQHTAYSQQHHQQHPPQQQQQHLQQPYPLSHAASSPAQPPQAPPSSATYQPPQYAGQHTQLPPIQPAAYAPPPVTTSAEQPNLPPLQHQAQYPNRHPSVPPTQEQPREGGPHYHSDYNHNHSGHATPAPVNRNISHDSGQQRTPATPARPPSYPTPAGHDGAPPQHQQQQQQQPPPPPPPPPGPGAPQPQMDHGVHQGYPSTNGAPPPGLPPNHPQQQHHDPHAAYMTPMIDPQHARYPPPPPPGQPMYSAPSYGHGPAMGNTYAPKRKQMRATQACEQCRQRKQKCDEGAPCSFCKENSLTCNYRDTPPAKTDKNMERLIQAIDSQNQNLERLSAQVEQIDRRVRQVEENTQGSHHRAQGSDSLQAMNTMNQTVAGAEQDRAVSTQPRVRKSPEMGDHRTAPHKLLLLWPSVAPLLRDAGVAHNDGYVMEAEDRGIIRLWARGEGIDRFDGTEVGGSASPASSEESGETLNAPTPQADGVWGVGFPSTPGSDVKRSDLGSVGGLKANGELDLDANTMYTLLDSYMKNIHVMHPFLDRYRLRRMFATFIKKYSTGRPRAAWAVGNDHGEPPLKRQRSNGATAINVSGMGSDTEVRRGPTERSPGNAIIYLVLAMGKICMCTHPLPGVVPESKLTANAATHHVIARSRSFAANSPASENIKQSPMSPSTTPATALTPPADVNMRMHDARSRRTSADGFPPPSAGPRNLDVIPGIAYYAKAAEILGDQADGNDLVHAQMFLLAALYKGQLARVKESMSWITMAGRAVINLLDRNKLYNNRYYGAFRNEGHKGDSASSQMETFQRDQARITDTRMSLIVLAAWTCLQLESDILAELRLPSSGIQSKEAILLMPHSVKDDESYVGLDHTTGQEDDSDNILIFYSAQLFLRRKLNEVHREMYGKDTLGKDILAIQSMLRGHETMLEAWRDRLPAPLSWDDDDQPPGEILSARLRAKYWGARYIINRPFLDYALHIMVHVENGSSIERAALDAHGNPRDKADVQLFKAIQQMSLQDITEAAQRCVYAAQKSTIAFDGIPGRLIVTNIHGTAHAQFGNMLVLCAVYHSKVMGHLVDRNTLERLLERTIKFLRCLSPISPTCKADCGILERFKNYLFPADEELPDVYKDEGVEAMSMSGSNSFTSVG